MTWLGEDAMTRLAHSPPGLARSWRDLQPAWRAVILKFRNGAMGENPRENGGLDGCDGQATCHFVPIASGKVGLHVNRFLAILHFILFFNSFFAISHSNLQLANWLHIAKNYNAGPHVGFGGQFKLWYFYLNTSEIIQYSSMILLNKLPLYVFFQKDSFLPTSICQTSSCISH